MQVPSTVAKLSLLSALTLATLQLSSCGEAPAILDACDDNDTNAICGTLSAEDMVVIPNTDWVVFSQMTEEYPQDQRNGFAIGMLNTTSNEILPLFDKTTKAAAQGFGDKTCEGLADWHHFEGHGLDVRQLDDGRILLAAVNHGEREAIEFFTIDDRQATPQLSWAGCLPLDRTVHHNDVAINADGSIFFTAFMNSRHHNYWGAVGDLLKSLFSIDNGYVNYWSEAEGLSKIAGSDSVMPNGIIATDDMKTLYVNSWTDQNVLEMTLENGAVSQTQVVDIGVYVDNSTWLSDSSFLVTGQDASFGEVIACAGAEPKTTCDINYGVFKVDRNTLQAERVITGKGTASVALPLADKTLVGSFAGDTIQIQPAI